MWHQVTTALRKSNPARGVLFMGAKAEPDPQNGGVKIIFSPDSSFAYAAAQKKEVKDLLAQTFIEVVGGAVPFQFVMAGGAPTPAQAAAQSAPAPASAPQTAQPAPAPAPTQQVTPQPSAQPTPVPAPAQQTAPQSPQPAPAPVPSTAGRYEDESPFWDDDPSVGQQTPLQPSAPASTPTASADPSVSAAPAPAQQQPVNMDASVAQPTEASEGALSESDQIKQILTASFGDGVKFDTI